MPKKPEPAPAAESQRVYLTLDEAVAAYHPRENERIYAVALEDGGIRYVPAKSDGKAAIAATAVEVKPVPLSEINEALNALLVERDRKKPVAP